MENNFYPLQVINGEGVFNVREFDEFMQRTELSMCGISYGVIAIMGPQSSGVPHFNSSYLLFLGLKDQIGHSCL